MASELRDVGEKLVDSEEKLRAARDVQERTEVVAPQSGKVVNLRYFTVGGVVKAGEPILDIIPQNDKLVIESELRPLDIDAVHQGLPATVRLIAYKQRRTPSIEGTVTHVSADRLVNPRTGQAFFKAEVEIDPEELARIDGGVTLSPGMPVLVLVKTGERTMLQYLTDPIRDSFARAFREK